MYIHHNILYYYIIDNQKAFYAAIEKSDMSIIKKFINNPEISISGSDNYAIKMAAAKGRADVVELLLQKGADPSADDHHTLYYAVTNGHLDVVNVLLKHPKVDPSVFDNMLLEIAKKSQRWDVFNRLLQDPRVFKAAMHPETLKFVGKEVLDKFARDLCKAKRLPEDTGLLFIKTVKENTLDLIDPFFNFPYRYIAELKFWVDMAYAKLTIETGKIKAKAMEKIYREDGPMEKLVKQRFEEKLKDYLDGPNQ